jgi:hypothetical protein
VSEALEHEAGEVDGRLRARLECDLHDPALDAGGLVVALDIVATDHVEHDIGAFAVGCRLGRRDEVLGLVVDRHVGAERLAGRAFLGVPAVVMTRAPNALASWIAVVPIPSCRRAPAASRRS